MPDKRKTKAQLAGELEALSQEIAEMRAAVAECQQIRTALQESEERYRQLAELLPDAILVHCNGRIAFINAAGAKILGAASPQELIGTLMMDVVHPDYQEAVKERIDQALEEGKPSNYLIEEKLVRLDGHVIDVEVTSTPLLYHDQPAILVVLRDITDRKRAESQRDAMLDALRDSEAKDRHLIQNANSIIFRMDIQGRVTFFNKYAQSFFGYTEGEVVGQNVVGTIVPERESSGRDLAALIQDLTQCPERYANHENENMRRNGERVWIAWTNKAILDDQGRVTEILCIGNDITQRVKAEEALRIAEREKETILDSQLEHVIYQDRENRILWPNRAACESVGATREELIGRHCYQIWPQRSERCTDCPVVLAMETGRQQEVKKTTHDGRAWFIRGYPVRDGNGEIAGAIEVTRDITEWVRAEEALHRRAEELDALQATVLDITTQHDLSNLLQAIVERATRLLYGSGGGMYLCDPDQEVARCVVSYNTPRDYAGTELNYGEGAAGAVAQTGEPLIIDDYRSWSGRAAAYEEEEPFTAVLSAPMTWQGQVTGVIHILDNAESRRFTGADLELLTSFANHASIAVHNAQLYQAAQQELAERVRAESQRDAMLEALRESEELFRLLFEQAPIGMAITALDGRYLRVNQSLCNTLGYTADELLARTVADVSCPEDWAPNLALREKTLRGEAPYFNMEKCYFTKEGKIVHTLLQVTLIRDSHDRPLHFVGQVVDITERVQAEEALRWERDRAMALEEATAAVSSTLDPNQVLDRILEQVSRVVPYDTTNIMLVEGHRARVVRWRGYEHFGAEEMVSTLVFQVSEVPILQHIIETREPLIIPDTTTYPAWVQMPPTGWICSYASAPIVVRDEVIGFLNVDSAIPGYFTQAHADTLRAFADHAAVAIQNARLYEAEQVRRQIAEILRQASTVLSSTLALDEVLELILRQLQQVIPYDSASVQRLQGEHLEISACRGFEEPGKVVGLVFPLDPKFPNHQVVTTRAPLAIEDISRDYAHFEDEADTYASGHICSWLGVPLMVKDQVIGMIALDRVEVRPFTTEEAQLAMAFANQAAIAIENARLFEETERYRAFNEGIVQTVPSAIVVTSAEGVFSFINPATVELLGYAPEELLGQHRSIIFPSDQHPIIQAADERHIRGQSDRYEVELLRKDGTRVPALASSSPWFDGGTGRFAGTLAVLTSITQRKRAEQLLHALNQAALAMEKALTPEEIFTATAKEFKKLGLSCVVFLTDETQSRLYPKHLNLESKAIKAAEKLAGVKTADFHVRIEAVNLYREVVWEKKTVFLENVEEAMRQTLPGPAKRFTGQIVRILKMSRFIATPLIVEDTVIGVLTVQSDNLTEDDVPAITAFSHQVAAAWRKAQLFEQAQQEINERMRAEEEIKRLKEFNEGIVQNMVEGITVEDTQGYFTFVNPAAATLLGFRPKELVGQHWTTIVPPDQQPIVQAANQRRARGERDQYELELVRKDGTRLPVLISGSPRFENGDPAGTLAVFTDITERVQAEQEIRRRNRGLMLLNQIIAASASGLEPEAVLETACRELARTFDVPQVTAALFNKEKTAASVIAEHRAKSRLPALNMTIPVNGSPSFQRILTNKAPLVVCDPESPGPFQGDDPHMEPIHDLMRQRGTVTLLVLPLVVEGDVVGILNLDATEPRHFSAEEVSLAWSVADQVGGALARARLNEQRQQLEHQYRQAQKMEAVGRLTAGIAHDFNNLLTAINGFAELTRFQLLPNDPLQEMVERILHSGRRAADLVRQLMAFSRKQVIEPQALNLNLVVAEMDRMLRRVIGEDVELKTCLAPDLWPVKVDPTQIEQVIANLAINARDAMPRGGRIIIETANVVLDQKIIPFEDFAPFEDYAPFEDDAPFEDCAASYLGRQPGEYVMLSVSDTGVGMSEEVQAHLFEPFFTTKEPGKGTGLGLATVFGAVKQSGGDIQVYSEEGTGTTFKIYLPRVEEVVQSAPRPRGMADVPSGNETILLVEDEESVRDLTRRVLQIQGYTVMEAANGQEATHLSANYPDPIHLLLTDLVMPGISGKALAEGLTQARPGLKVLFMSGYTNELVADHGMLEPGVAFLQKPFSPMDLARKVRQLLDAPQP